MEGGLQGLHVATCIHIPCCFENSYVGVYSEEIYNRDQHNNYDHTPWPTEMNVIL